MKVAFLFSGQGAQYFGMGKELYDNFQICRDTFEAANNSLDFNVKDICFNENEFLNKTEYTQPAILTTSISIFNIINQKDIKANFLAGLSLGEYSALVASGAICFEDAVRLVRKRGQYMEEAAFNKDGAMSAILNLDANTIEDICKKASDSNFKVYIANYNEPSQIVIAGHTKAVEIAEKLAKEEGAKKVIRLNVSGPFHTELLKSASDKLLLELEKVSFNKMHTPVLTNLTGEIVLDSDLKNTLTKQVISPVKFMQIINNLIKLNVDTFVELGPSKVLSFFVKKINKNVNVYNIEDLKSFEKTCKGLGL